MCVNSLRMAVAQDGSVRAQRCGMGHEPAALVPGPGPGPGAGKGWPVLGHGPGSGFPKGDNRHQGPAGRSSGQAEAGDAQELDSSGHREADPCIHSFDALGGVPGRWLTSAPPASARNSQAQGVAPLWDLG